MLSALTFIKAGFGLLAKVPWWVWPIVVLALWGAFGHHKANGLQKQVDTAAAEHRARLAMAEEVGRMLKSSAARLKGIRDETDTRTAARLESQLRELRSRPDRLPAAAASTCEGATGRQLSREDSAFLVRLAAEADRVAAALVECQGWISEVTSSRGTEPR